MPLLTRLLGPMLLCAGLVILAVAIGGIRNGGWLQVLVVVIGAALLFNGIGKVARRRFGPHVDVTAWLCAVWLIVLISAAVFAPLLPIGEHQDLAATLSEPTMARPDLLSAHPLGTNNFGLDLLTRVLYGARVSLIVSIGAVLMGMVFGGLVGIVAGFRRGPVDWVASVLTNSFLAVPPLILLIALATVLEPTLQNIAFALSLLATPSMIRIARASTMALAEREFVMAGRAMGASNLRVMVRELLPNVALPLASYGMVMISVLIVAEASLSFLGLGVEAPAPSWGNMIAEGQGRVFEQNPHIVLVPGVVLFFTVFAFNALGERARSRFDSRAGKL
ncbi:ABC transporter permease [Pimelobacter simplex]|nr:ABC transporter permease [Pimelobacter simplex]